MKAMPLADLIALLGKLEDQIIYKDEIQQLFETYGDDWYIGDRHDRLELCNENELRKEVLMDDEKLIELEEDEEYEEYEEDEE